MTPILNHNHPAAAQPMPSRDPINETGQGTQVQTNNTGAPIAVRSTQVQITNPGMKAAARNGPLTLESKRRITARAVDVSVRSGNNDPTQTVDSQARSFIWGLRGEGDPKQPTAGQKYGLLALVGVGLAFAFMSWKAGAK